MTPEELDLAIEALLEEQPNQDKPYRRRRDKFKDLRKQARRGEFSIPDTIMEELVGKPDTRLIESVYVYYTEQDNRVCTANGWYDDIKQIAKELEVPTHVLRLKKITAYDWENDRVFWDGESIVYEKAIIAHAQFYDKDNQYITSRGIYKEYNVGYVPPIEEGYYLYDEAMQEEIESMFGSSPAVEQEFPSYRGYRTFFRRGTETPFDDETTGRFNMYRLAYLEQENSGYLKKCEPIYKGDINGTKNRLLQAVNANGYHKKDLLDGVDDLIIDYEFAHTDIIYDYYW